MTKLRVFLVITGALFGVRPHVQAQTQTLKVLATTTFLADLAQNVAGEVLEVHSLMPIGGDPHIYDPVPGDAQKIVEADLILRNGLHLEGWLDEMIENAGGAAKVHTLTQGLPAIQSSDFSGAYDPHAWMNPQFALVYIENIKTALSGLIPEKAAVFEANYQAYRQEILELDAYIEKQILKIPEERRVLITSHDAFRYYGNRYGMKVHSVLGTSTEADVRMADVRHLVATIESTGVPAVFIESTINPKLLQQLAGDNGISIGGRLFADSLGDKESGADTYLKMLRQNTDLIVQGLTIPGGMKKEEEGKAFIWVISLIFATSFLVVGYRLRSLSKTGMSWKDYSLEIKGLSVTYDRKTALANVFLTLESGYVTGLVGGNGSGKSTLFKAILGLVQPDAGSITLNGESVDDLRRYISYIPQKEEIDWSFPATVFDVVLLGRYPHRKVTERLTEEDRKKALAALEMLGIMDLKDKQIGELSGGQQQRAFIARALCQEAEVYLLDEPFVGVDVSSEKKIIEIMKDLAARGKMVIIIHHDLAKVQDYFGRLVMINQRVVASGPTEEVFTDDNIKKTYGGRLTILQKTESFWE